MAPEAIAKKRYSERSDSFAFGVYMWEVLHRALPFEHLDTFEIATGVVQGTLRLEVERDLLPREARINSTLTTLMTDCWEHKPTERPDFLAIRRRLKYHYADALDQKL